MYSIGDILKTPRCLGLYAHYGVYFGNHLVLEFAGDQAKDVTTARPRISHVDAFADGHPVEVVGRSSSTDAQMAERLQEVLSNPARYNAYSYNCEHLARYVATGVRRSTQSDRVTFAGLVVFALWLLGED